MEQAQHRGNVERSLHLQAAATYPALRHVPAIVDECDPCVPAHFNRYDNPNFGFRNTAYFASAMVSIFKRVLDLNEALPDAPDVALVYGKQRGDERTKYAEHRVFAAALGEAGVVAIGAVVAAAAAAGAAARRA